MASQLSNNHDEPIATINMTPFVDIILVVLIIFMVTTPIILKPSIGVNLPKAQSGDQTKASQLMITITAKSEVFLNGKVTNEIDLSSYAKDLANKNQDTQAIIAADKDVQHGKVIEVLDSVKNAGIKKFAITIDKK